MADDYVCTLNDKDLKKAKDELNEDPKERLGAVETLRQWVKQQRHLRSPTDTAFLLRFLRCAKFSQMKARKILDGYWTNVTENAAWYNMDNVPAEKLEMIYGEGVLMVLPGYDNQGRKIVFMRQGLMDATWTRYSFDELALVNMSTMTYLISDERVQVNGVVFISDLTGFSFKHQTSISPSMIKRSASFMQGKFPMRFKGFHYYNTGPFFEAVFTIFKLMLSKKLQDRIIIHDTMENVYKYIPMEMLPSDFLPDDYSGKHAGTIEEIIAQHKAEMMKPEVQANMRKYMNPEFGVDESKRVKEDIPQGSFRKLNID